MRRVPTVWLHLEWGFGMQRGQVLADQFLQVQFQTQAASLVRIFDQQLQPS